MFNKDIIKNIQNLIVKPNKALARASISYLSQYIEEAINYDHFFEIDYENYGESIIQSSSISADKKEQIRKLWNNQSRNTNLFTTDKEPSIYSKEKEPSSPYRSNQAKELVSQSTYRNNQAKETASQSPYRNNQSIIPVSHSTIRNDQAKEPAFQQNYHNDHNNTLSTSNSSFYQGDKNPVSGDSNLIKAIQKLSDEMSILKNEYSTKIGEMSQIIINQQKEISYLKSNLPNTKQLCYDNESRIQRIENDLKHLNNEIQKCNSRIDSLESNSCDQSELKDIKYELSQIKNKQTSLILKGIKNEKSIQNLIQTVKNQEEMIKSTIGNNESNLQQKIQEISNNLSSQFSGYRNSLNQYVTKYISFNYSSNFKYLFFNLISFQFLIKFHLIFFYRVHFECFM